MSVCLPCRQYCYRRLAQRTKSTAAPRLESVGTVASLRYFSDAAIAVSQHRNSSQTREWFKRRGPRRRRVSARIVRWRSSGRDQ